MNTGSMNDCTAWDKSRLKKLIDEGALHDMYSLIGDEAFTRTSTRQFLVP